MAIDVKDMPAGTDVDPIGMPDPEAEAAEAAEPKQKRGKKKAAEAEPVQAGQEFVASRKALLEGVNQVARAISARTSLPILTHILIETVGSEEVKLTATDLEVGIEVVVPADVKTPGRSTLPARPLSEVVSQLSGDEVTIAVSEKNQKVTVKSGVSDYQLLSLDPDEFPQLSSVTETATFKVAGRTLRRALKRTLFCVSGDESRASLTGVLFKLEGGGVEVCATDTHRLSVVKLEVSDLTGDATVIVPSRALGEMAKLAPDSEEEMVDVTVGASSIRFVSGKNVLVTRVIEGAFPNYARVIPSAFERKVEAPYESLMQGVRRAEIVAKDDASRISFDIQGKMAVLTAESTSIGHAYEEVDIVLTGEPLLMAFNGKYMLEMLQAFDSETVVFDLGGALQPARVTDGQTTDFLHVLMPMQIR